MKHPSTPPSSPSSKNMRLVRRSPRHTLPTPPSTPSPPPPVAIDHRAFPHLVDEIIHYSSREGLLRLRTASRALQLAADREMAHHVVLTQHGIEHPTGRNPSFRNVSAGTGRQRQRQLALLAHTQVVDVRGAVSLPPELLAALRPSFARMFAYAWPPIAVPDTVFLAQLASMAGLDGVRRVIVHSATLSRLTRFPASMEELVVVFRGEEAGPVVDTAIAAITKHVANYACGGVMNVRFTVVDLPCPEGGEETKDEEGSPTHPHETKFRRAITKGIEYGAGPDAEVMERWSGSCPWKHAEAKTIAKGMEFVSAAAGEHLVGSRQWQLCNL